jgi:hypothetical protein
MGYAFGLSYLNQYPSEQVGPSTFACDTTIRNAQFDSSLQSLAVPVPDEVETIFNLLEEQNFTLQLQFINTAFSCMDLSISEVTDSSTISVISIPCTDVNGTLSVSLPLLNHQITIVATLAGIQLVGGIRLGLSGPGQESDSSTLQELNFLQAFYSSSSGTLSQTPSITMTLTKVSCFNFMIKIYIYIYL